jgi:hypothetical protein
MGRARFNRAGLGSAGREVNELLRDFSPIRPPRMNCLGLSGLRASQRCGSQNEGAIGSERIRWRTGRRALQREIHPSANGISAGCAGAALRHAVRIDRNGSVCRNATRCCPPIRLQWSHRLWRRVVVTRRDEWHLAVWVILSICRSWAHTDGLNLANTAPAGQGDPCSEN